MALYGRHPRSRDVPDPSDPVWQWFVRNGPHGERFSWHKEVPLAQRDIELLAELIEERERANPGFATRTRSVALEALELNDAILVRTGIQVLAVVGTDEDLEHLKQFVHHPDPTVVIDARCCLFEGGIKSGR
jgi:hypothetical protein